MRSTDVPSSSRLIITSTPAIRSFLLSVTEEPICPQELRDTATELSSKDEIPYKSLIRIWFESDHFTRPELVKLFAGCEFVLRSPEPREKCEELKERLKKLEELAERKAYRELVKDIIKDIDPKEPLSSYKDQIGFGVHVVLVMFTGYIVGCGTFKALFSNNPAVCACGGVLGLVGGMLLETLLFMIRSSNQSLPSPTPISRLKKEN